MNEHRSQGGWGDSHTISLWVCATQWGRDFGAPDLEQGNHFRQVSWKRVQHFERTKAPVL